MTLSLGGLVDAIDNQQYETVVVDLREFARNPEDGIVLTLREPDTILLHQVAADAFEMKKASKGDWPDNLCWNVAMIALAHVSPQPALGEPPVGKLYMQLADPKKNSKAWSKIAGTFFGKWPYLMRGAEQQAVEDEKKD